eukprot:7347766-Pyramimonas_sp.AAC.1
MLHVVSLVAPWSQRIGMWASVSGVSTANTSSFVSKTSVNEYSVLRWGTRVWMMTTGSSVGISQSLCGTSWQDAPE